jgi:hypothetical protein
MAGKDRQQEIDRNLEFFKKELPKLLKDHRNRFALLHDCSVSGIYDTIRDAQTAGDKLFPDQMYSIQKITDQAINLGFYSYAGSLA